MTSFLFAAIIGVAVLLVAAVLLLKKRTSPHKTSPIDVVAPTDKAATQESAAGQTAEQPPIEPDAALERPVSPQRETVPAPEPAGGRAEGGSAVVLEEVPAVADLAAIAQEKAMVTEAVSPSGTTAPVEATPAPETVLESQPADEEIFLPEESGDAVAATCASPKIWVTLEAYSAWLNLLEGKQRALLDRAIQRHDDRQRDQLQRELVIMNDKLALLADSYAADLSCYQQILAVLERVQGDGVAIAAAKETLQKGDPQAAENFFAQLSAQQNSFAAQAAFHSGQLAECRVDLQKALDFYRRAVDLEPENLQYLQAAGKTARSIYRYKEALAWLESFVRLSGEHKEIEPADQALAQRELAYTYVLSGQYQKAGPLYKEAMTTLAQKLGQDHPEMATSWYQLGELQETLGEYDKAVTLYRKSLEILEKKRGQDHPVLAGILDKLAALCMELEMEKQAVPLYERLVRIREKALRPTHPQLALSLNNLAESYRLQGQYAKAEACYQKSLRINETIHGPEHPSVAAVLQELAKLCTSQRKPEEAAQYQQRATAIFQMSVEASEQKTGQEALTLEI